MRLKRADFPFGPLVGGAILLGAVALLPISQSACSSSDSPATPAPVGDAGVEAAAAPPPKTEAEYQEEAARSTKTIVLRQITAFNQAAIDLQAAAPATAGRGWDPTQDAAAIATMKEAWKRAHVAYEHVGPMFSGPYAALDVSINARYDDFLKTLGAVGDPTLFDDQGVTGIHAIERILFAPSIPAAVTTEEAKIPGYKAATFPSTEAEAADFKNKLAAKLVTDTKAILDQYTAATVDNKVAFANLTLLMNNQRDIVTTTATVAERSRYSQQTLADLQAALEGTELAYKIFQPWLLQGHMNPQDLTKHGPAHDKPIQAGFGDLGALYTATAGDAMPPPPATWNATAPTPDDLKTLYGKIFALINTSTDPAHTGSVVSEMNIAGTILGLK